MFQRSEQALELAHLAFARLASIASLASAYLIELRLKDQLSGLQQA